MRAFALRHRKPIRLLLKIAALALFLVALGSFLFPERLGRGAFVGALGAGYLLELVQFLLFGRDKTRAEIKDLRPARAALGVILFTGLVGAFVLGKQFDSYVVTFGLIVMTGVAAAAAYSFAERHADDIGEARFDTRNSRDEQGKVDQR